MITHYGEKPSLYAELLQRSCTIYLLLRPCFEGSPGIRVLSAAGTQWFLLLSFFTHAVTCCSKPIGYGVQRRQKAEGASRQVPSPEMPRVQRGTWAPQTQGKDGARGVLTKGAASTSFVFQWQLRGARGQKPRAESRGEGGGDGTGQAKSLEVPARTTLIPQTLI